MNNDITQGTNKAINLTSPGSYRPGEFVSAGEPAAAAPSPEPVHPPETSPSRPKKSRFSVRRMGGFALIIVAFGVGTFVYAAARNGHATPSVSESLVGQVKSSESIPLASLSQSLLTQQGVGARQLTINGQLNVTDTMVLTPIDQPKTGVAGQLYYDKTSNQLAYYNGTQFVTLQGGGNVTNNVNNVTNQGGNVTNVTNVTDVTNVQSGGGGGVAAANGTAGALAYFTDATTLGSSLITQTGGGVIVKPQSDVTTAFQVQNAAGTAVLTADTVNNVITSSASVIVNSPSACSYTGYTSYVGGLSPTSYWKLEDTGATATDSSGNGNTGTLTNVTTNQTPGPFTCGTTHPGMAFNGTTSTMTTPHSLASPTSYSEVAMFKTTGRGTLVGFSDGGSTQDRTLFVDNTGKLNAMIFNGTLTQTITSQSTVNDGAWHIAVVSESGAGLFLYVDGNLQASNVAFTSPQSYTGSWYVGAVPGDVSFNGDLAQVAITPAALSALQAQTLAVDAGFYGGNLSSVGIGTTAPAANLDVEGTALFKSPAASTTAFQVQDAAGDPVLLVDTTVDKVRVDATGLNNGNLSNSLTFGEAGSGEAIASKRTPGGNNDGLDFYTNSTNVFNLSNGGWATFQNKVNDTHAFQIQNAASNALFTADTINMSVTVGGALNADGSALFRNGTNSTTALQVQTADGLTNLLSVDTTDKALTLGTGAGASLGYTSVGTHSWGGSGQERILASKFTTTGGGAITSMSAYNTGTAPAPHNNFQFAVYSDNAGTPGTYIASSSIGTLPITFGWFSAPITATLSPATTYWLVYLQDNNLNDSNDGLAFDVSVSGTLTVDNTFPWQSGPNNGFPTAFPTAGEVTNVNLAPSMYATFASSGPALLLNSAGTLTHNGAAIFADPSNSPTALQIQNATGTNLLVADTAGMKVTVQALVVTADLTVNGHIITGGSAPGIAAGAAACTTPTVSIAGNDTAGTITVITGSGCTSSGTLATITFAKAYAVAPRVVLTPGNSASQTLGAYVDDSTISGTAFGLGTNATPANATTFKWNYWVAQ